jgi:hypothetical protein
VKRRIESEAEKRLWNVLLIVGAGAAVTFLGFEVYDFIADAGRPHFQQNDLYSALGSLAMLAIVGIVAGRREQIRRDEAAASAAPRARKRERKRAPARRKGRA